MQLPHLSYNTSHTRFLGLKLLFSCLNFTVAQQTWFQMHLLGSRTMAKSATVCELSFHTNKLGTIMVLPQRTVLKTNKLLYLPRTWQNAWYIIDPRNNCELSIAPEQLQEEAEFDLMLLTPLSLPPFHHFVVSLLSSHFFPKLHFSTI